jgi:type IV secretory pathway VirB3-like protein
MGGRGNSINSPLLSFEVSQSGYGMYVKYIMAGFLIIFAVSMMVQFVSYLLFNIAQLCSTDDGKERQSYQQLIAEHRS